MLNLLPGVYRCQFHTWKQVVNDENLEGSYYFGSRSRFRKQGSSRRFQSSGRRI